MEICCKNPLLFHFCLPLSPRIGEDKRVGPCYQTKWSHCVRKAGQWRHLETNHQCRGGDCHRRHSQLPHSDFQRVQGGQRLLQRLGPGGLMWWGGAIMWLGESCSGPGSVFPFWGLCSNSLQLLPAWSVVCLHAQSHYSTSVDGGKDGGHLCDITHLFLTWCSETKWLVRPYLKSFGWQVSTLTAIGHPSVTWSQLCL